MIKTFHLPIYECDYGRIWYLTSYIFLINVYYSYKIRMKNECLFVIRHAYVYLSNSSACYYSLKMESAWLGITLLNMPLQPRCNFLIIVFHPFYISLYILQRNQCVAFCTSQFCAFFVIKLLQFCQFQLGIEVAGNRRNDSRYCFTWFWVIIRWNSINIFCASFFLSQ